MSLSRQTNESLVKERRLTYGKKDVQYILQNIHLFKTHYLHNIALLVVFWGPIKALAFTKQVWLLC